MSRLVELTEKEMLPPEAHAAYDMIADSRSGRVGGPFGILLRSPEVATRIAHFGTYVRFESSIPAPVRAIAALVPASELECVYMLAGHPQAAANAGVSAAAIECILNRSDVTGLAPEEAQPILFARDVLTRHRVDNDCWKMVLAQLRERGITEFMATIGYYTMLTCILNPSEVPGSSSPRHLARDA